MTTMLRKPLLALALAAFGVGTTEFVIMGLLPQVAADLDVDIPAAGLLVSAYALGVAGGGPLLAILLARVPARVSLLALLALFVAGNVGCALAPGYGWLMAARIVTAFCHAAFFGIGAVLAAETAPRGRQAQAIAVMISGLTVANVLGVPIGTFIGQAFGWRAAFWGVAAIGVLAFGALAAWIPNLAGNPRDLVDEMKGLADPRIWIVLALSVVGSASMFAFFTYITPFLTEVTHLPNGSVSCVLLGFGLGLTVGNTVGARLADWRALPTLSAMLALSAMMLVVIGWGGSSEVVAIVAVALWGIFAFAVCTVLQAMVVKRARRGANLASTLNISSFNLGNAIGASVGAMGLARGVTVPTLPFLAAVIAVAGLALSGAAMRMERVSVQRSLEQAA